MTKALCISVSRLGPAEHIEDKPSGQGGRACGAAEASKIETQGITPSPLSARDQSMEAGPGIDGEGCPTANLFVHGTEEREEGFLWF